MKQKQIYPISMQSNVLLEILIYLINIIIIVCYYIFIYKYILDINYEVVTTCTITTTVEKLEPTEVPNIWYKSIIDDFFSKFTVKSKTIDHKFF